MKKEFYALISLFSSIFLTFVKVVAALLTNSLSIWTEAAD